MFSDTVKRNFLILAGTLIWSVTMVKSGLNYAFGLGFWGPNGHDGIWHISLIRSLSRGSLDMPLFAGETIKNYHVGFDVLVAIVHDLSRIPVSWLYFQILPPLIALGIGYLVYKLIFLWTKSAKAAFWSVFFTYFGSSFGWIVTLIRSGSLGGESLFWAQQAVSTLVNPPFALSLLLILFGLWLLQTKHHVWAVVIFALVPSIKIYGGILVYTGLFFAGFKNRYCWKVLAPSFVFGMLLFLPLNTHSSRLVVWNPLWFLRNLMNPDHLDWPQYFSALDSYTSGRNWFKGVPAYMIALVIFLIGNLGLRILSLSSLLNRHRLQWWEVFFWSTAVCAIIPPLLLLQQGTAWNTIQFFYYTQFFLGILAGIGLANLRLGKFIPAIVAAMLIVGTYATLPNYLPARPPSMISQPELSALKFLSNQPRGTVLTAPFDKTKADAAVSHPPRPLYLYESTAYVSAYSGQLVYLEDEVNLNITGYSWQSRRTAVLNYFSKPDRAFLDKNHITYIYLVGDQRQPLQDHVSSLSLIYSNSQVDIYRVN